MYTHHVRPGDYLQPGLSFKEVVVVGDVVCEAVHQLHTRMAGLLYISNI